MARILHLTDLHLLPGSSEQETILSALVDAIESERAEGAFDLMCITGDVFETSTLDARRAVERFSSLLDEIDDALGGSVPCVIVPGNHDRRRRGVFLPHGERLFLALREALGTRAIVHGCDPHSLAAVVPQRAHGLPMWIVAYDSTHVPHGVFGAGGALREEDLLRAASVIDGSDDWPVLFLLHHHLIPTPLTDLETVDSEGAPAPLRWLLERVLPHVIAHADRDELFMTALGAGTALSILHAMGRAVLVLHGHKHYASARLLTATQPGQGDVLIVSGGSAGTAQQWTPSPHRDTARLWPSFNVVELEGGELRADTIAFKWRAQRTRSLARRPMVRARREGARWIVDPTAHEAAHEPGPRLAMNDARFELFPSRQHGGGRWDCEVTRTIAFHSRREARRYVETVSGPHGARLSVGAGVTIADGADLPAQLVLEPRMAARYDLAGGLARTIDEESRIEGRDATPYGRLALMNRYPCDRARLVVKGLGAKSATAFGSATDLGTGLSRPLPVAADPVADRVELALEDCPPRTLLRIYWQLDAPMLAPRALKLAPPAHELAIAGIAPKRDPR